MILFFLLIFITLTPAALYSAEPQYILIKKPGQYIRQSADISAKPIAHAKVGDAFKVVTLKGQFFEILLPSGKNAYVLIDIATIITRNDLEKLRAEKKLALAEDPAPRTNPKIKDKVQQETEWLKDKYVQIAESKANLRSSPGIASKIIRTAKRGDVFKILARTNNWIRIYLPPDQEAFVSSHLVIIVTEDKLLSPNKGTNGIGPEIIND